jgi:hypothetical protein
MNNKKGIRKGIKGIALAAILIASIFAVIATAEDTTLPASPLDYDAGKNTLEGPSGPVNDDLSYARGETVYYRIYFTPTSENVNVTGAKDIFPDNSESPLEGTYPFALAKDTTKTWEVRWDIPSDWPNDTIANRAEIYLTDQFGTPNMATVSITSTIISEPTPTPTPTPPPTVPALTSIGIVVLVGLLSIIAISKMRRRGK